MKKSNLNLIITIVSFLPTLLVALFANPVEGAFSKSLETFITLIVTGTMASFVFCKYSQKNGIGTSLAWISILAIGLGVASIF